MGNLELMGGSISHIGMQQYNKMCTHHSVFHYRLASSVQDAASTNTTTIIRMYYTWLVGSNIHLYGMIQSSAYITPGGVICIPILLLQQYSNHVSTSGLWMGMGKGRRGGGVVSHLYVNTASTTNTTRS